MENKKQVSLITVIGDYEIGVGNEYHSPLFCILVRRVDCAQLAFYCPIPKMLSSSLLTFEFEICDGVISIYHVVLTNRQIEGREKLCRIPISLIDLVSKAFSIQLENLPQDPGLSCDVLLRDVDKSISCSINLNGSSHYLAAGFTEESQILSKWICSKDLRENEERPSEDAVVSSLMYQMCESMIDIASLAPVK